MFHVDFHWQQIATDESSGLEVFFLSYFTYIGYSATYTGLPLPTPQPRKREIYREKRCLNNLEYNIERKIINLLGLFTTTTRIFFKGKTKLSTR